MKKLNFILIMMMSIIKIFGQNGHLDGVECINNRIRVSGWSTNASGSYDPINIYVDGNLALSIPQSNVQRSDVAAATGSSAQVGFEGYLDICWSNGINRSVSAQHSSSGGTLYSSPKSINCSGGSGNCGGTNPPPVQNPGNYQAISGYVGINMTNNGQSLAGLGSFQLAVNGKIITNELRVRTGWADYVFDKSYQLRPLSEVENFIHKNHHLPNIPSAAQVEEQGISLGEMQAKLLEKIEELTLYQIQNDKMIKDLEKKINVNKRYSKDHKIKFKSR